MAQDIVGSLFGVSANDLQAQRQAAAQAQARQFAQMQPAEMVNYAGYMAGNQLGGALAGMMGAKDPELEKANMVNSLVKETDMTDLDSVKGLVGKLNQFGATREAMALLPRIDALTKQTEDRTARTEDKQAAIEARREEIRLRGEQRLEEIRLKAEADLQRARERAATDKELNQIRVDAQREMVNARLQMSQLIASTKSSGKEDKPIPASTLKMYTEAKTTEEKLGNSVVKADEFITKLDKGDIKFGLVENVKSGVRTVMGRSNESDQNKNNMKSYVQGVVNDILMAARGTQTADDAKRAEQQVMTALAQNDDAQVKNSLQWIKRLLIESKNIAATTRKDVELLGGIGNKEGQGTTSATPSKPKTKKGTTYQIIED